MRNISPLEEETLAFWAGIGTAAIFGCVNLYTLTPVHAAVRSLYEKIKGDKTKIRDLYERNTCKILTGEIDRNQVPIKERCKIAWYNFGARLSNYNFI